MTKATKIKIREVISSKGLYTGLLVLVLLLFLVPPAQSACPIGAANCRTYEQTLAQFAGNIITVGTDITENANFTFTSGKMLLIPNGRTYTGNINGQNLSNVVLCIAGGGNLGTWVNFNNFAGTIRNYNTTLTLNFSNFKYHLENYGGTIVINSGEGRNILNCNGTINWKSNLNLNGYSIYNSGTFVLDYELQGGSGCIANYGELHIGDKNVSIEYNAYSASIQFENFGFAHIKGKMQGSGNVLNEAWMTIGTYVGNNNITNNGKIEVVGTSLYFNGGTVINNCAMFSNANGAQFQNNTSITNNGLIYLPVGNFENKAGYTFSNGTTGVVRTRDLSNEGIVSGGGYFYVSNFSHNKNNGTFGIGTNVIHFYDALPGGNPCTFNIVDGGSTIGSGVLFTPFPEPIYSPDLSNYACGEYILSVSIDPGNVAASQVLCTGINPEAFTSTEDARCSEEGATITYQWQNSTDNLFFSNISGAVSSTYSVGSRPGSLTYYRRKASASFTGIDSVKNTSGFSDVLSLTPISRMPASITANPSEVKGCPGIEAQYTASATNYDSRQWQISTDNGVTWNNLLNGGIYSGVETGTLTVSEISSSMDGYLYRMAAINNDCGTVTSTAALLEVLPPDVLEITQQPELYVLCFEDYIEGSPAVYTVESPCPDCTYQWQNSQDPEIIWTNSTSQGNNTPTLIVDYGSDEYAPGRYSQFRCLITSVSGCSNAISEKAGLLISEPFVSLDIDSEIKCPDSDPDLQFNPIDDEFDMGLTRVTFIITRGLNGVNSYSPFEWQFDYEVIADPNLFAGIEMQPQPLSGTLEIDNPANDQVELVFYLENQTNEPVDVSLNLSNIVVGGCDGNWYCDPAKNDFPEEPSFCSPSANITVRRMPKVGPFSSN